MNFPLFFLLDYLKYITLVKHSIRDLDETCDISTFDQRWQDLTVLSVLLGIVDTFIETVDHNSLQLLVNSFASPCDSLRVLCHF